MKKEIIIFSLIIITIAPLFSKNLLNVDFALFDKIIELNFVYTQEINDEKIVSNIKISKSKYAEEEIIIYKSSSSKYESLVYLKLNGELIKTKIHDKKNKIRYTINYGKFINITIITENKKYEKTIDNDCLDVSALALLLSVYHPKKDESINIKILDYKNMETNEVTLKIIDTESHTKIGNVDINAVKYEISSFLFYNSVMYYGKGKLPVLLYYEGPASINFLERTRLSITPQSYFDNISILNN